MRSLRKSWIGIVLIFLFTLSLFFWRQGSRYSKIFESDNVLAKVGSTEISTTRFNRALQLNIKQFNQILGKELTGEEIKNFQIHQLALQAIVNETVFENEFDKLNFKIDKTIIAKKTKEIIPQLYNENNELDEIYLNEFLSKQGLKIEDIVQILHYDVRNEYFNSILLDIEYPNSFSENIETYNNHKRDIEYLNIPIELINVNNELKDNENNLQNILLEYYKTNLSQYMSNEKRDIKYIIINKDDYLNSFMPSENEALKYYNNNSDLYLINEKRSFLQFNFKTSEEAKNLKKRIEIFNSYNDIKAYAEKENIEFNVFENLLKDEMLEEIAESLFTLNVNEQSSIIRTPIANHIVVVKSIQPEKKLSFIEAKDNIIQTISNIDVNNFLIDLENKISQDILERLSLKEIAQKHNLKLSFMNNISRTSNNFDKSNKILFENMLENAFDANLNFINDIIKLDNNKSYTFEVVKISESQPLNFNSIKNIVLDDWTKYKQIDKIELLIKNNAKNSNFLKDLEEEFNKKIENFSIKYSNSKLPRDLIVDLFNSEPNTISYKVGKTEIHLSKLLKINIDEKPDTINEQISLNDEIRSTLYNELLKETKISTNNQMLNAILNSY